jgi:hypothetical protein
MPTTLTWTCHVCGDERPDSMIAVAVHDLSADHGMPPGTIQRNVRYCADRRDCIRAAHEPTRWRMPTSATTEHRT